MVIIHADENRKEKRVIRRLKDFDCEISLEEKNDFKLSIPAEVYKECPIEIGHFLYVENTEWGGVVNKTVTLSEEVEIYGATWRGYLNKNVIIPPPGSAYLNVSGNAKTVIASLLNEHFGDLVEVESTDIIVNGELRYNYIGEAIQKILSAKEATLNIQYKNGGLKLEPREVIDWSAKYEIDEDYGLLLKIEIDKSKYYNHIIGLGGGVLEDRLVVESWMLQDGTVIYAGDDPRKPSKLEEKTYILDYPNAESETEIKESIEKKFAESKQITKTEADLSGTQIVEAQLGDLVASKNALIGASAKQQITNILIKINDIGKVQIRYQIKEVQ